MINNLNGTVKEFAEACYCHANSIDELKEILEYEDLKCDCDTWGLTKSEAKTAIKAAIQELESEQEQGQ